MDEAPVAENFPADEQERSKALDKLKILNSLPEQAYEDIVLVASLVCNCPAATIGFPVSDRIWFKARRGVEPEWVDRETSFCVHTIRSGSLVMVPDAEHDERFQSLPLVCGPPYVRRYFGVPIFFPGGKIALGSLCVVGDKPGEISGEQLRALTALAGQVGLLLELRAQAMHLSDAAQKQAESEAAARESARYLERILNGISDPIFVKDSQSKYILLNDACCRFHGNTREALLADLWGNSVIRDSYTEAIIDHDRQVLESGQELSVESSITDPSGHRRDLLIKKAVSPNTSGEKQIIGIVPDFSCLRALQQTLKFRNEELERSRLAVENARYAAETTGQRMLSIVNAIADPILVKDRQHRWILYNDALCKLVGRDRAELLGESDYQFLPKEQADCFWAGDEKVFGTGQELETVEQLTDASGGSHTLKTKRCLFTDCTGVQFLVGILRDVTIEKQYEREIEAKNLELDWRRMDADRASSLKSQFLASVSHEFRSPLQAILGFTELAQSSRTGLSSRNRKYLRYISTAGEQLLAIINQVLDLSKIESGQVDLWKDDFDATAEMDTVIETMQPVAKEKQISLCRAGTETVVAHADPSRFQQILMNLIGNAIKFTPEGGVVTLEARYNRGLAEFMVTDTGIGIAPEDHETIFQEFRQVGTTTSGVREGTGLGLAIVKRLVEQMRGGVRVESAHGAGSRFIFSLPAGCNTGVSPEIDPKI